MGVAVGVGVGVAVGEGLPTMVTTNLLPRSKARIRTLEDLDPRVASRIEGGLVVRWIGPDRRRARAS